MPETIVLLDMTTPERADRLRALLPPGFVLTHGTARGDEHMKEIIADADYAISGQVGSGRNLRPGADSRNSTRPENSTWARRARSAS